MILDKWSYKFLTMYFQIIFQIFINLILYYIIQNYSNIILINMLYFDMPRAQIIFRTLIYFRILKILMIL